MVGEPLEVAAGETLPHWAAEQFTLHIIPALLLMVAVNCAVRPGGTVAADGVTITTTCGTMEVEAQPPENRIVLSKRREAFFTFPPPESVSNSQSRLGKWAGTWEDGTVWPESDFGL